MNPKARGEKGQRIAIGELAKWDIDVAVPLTDNLPWDFIIIHHNNLFKAQVKSSKVTHQTAIGSISLDIRTNNWYKITHKRDTSDDCDIMILCDYQNVYILSLSDFTDRSNFSIRTQPSRNGQSKKMNMHDDFVISTKRIKQVLS